MNYYIENPKTKGSGIICCIPQKGVCPNKCEDCFFQSGRSYLEPLEQNLPNIPTPQDYKLYRINDGNDSNVQKELVIKMAKQYKMKYYNTSINNLDGFDAPIVLTLNPSVLTDSGFHFVDPIPPNLMFVRFRTNMWNLDFCDDAVEYYTKKNVPIVLTFMAYFNLSIPEEFKKYYIFRKRTLNSYWAITTEAWEQVMSRYKYNKWVYSCGKIEGEKGDSHCRFCGNCLREYFATMERMKIDEIPDERNI